MKKSTYTLLLGALAVLGLFSLACAGVEIKKTYTIDQTALTPAPTGPAAVGALTRDGKVSASGGLSGNWTSQAETLGERSAIGHRSADKAIHARIAYGLQDRLEFGLDVNYSNAAWGKGSSPDRDNVELENPHALWLGPQFRFIAFGTRKLGIGGLFELDVGNVPYKRYILTETQVTLISADDSVDNFVLPTTTSQSEIQQESVKPVRLRGGIQGFASIADQFIVNGGFLVQNSPLFFGQRKIDETCTWSPVEMRLEETCEGQRPEDLEPYRSAVAFTPFAGASWYVPETGFSIHAQIFGNVLGDEDLIRTSPFGGDFRLRYEFSFD